MIFYRWGNWGLYSPPALLLTHDIPPKPTVCMGSPPKRGIHLVYALPPGYHISSLFLFTSCLPVNSRLVLSFWLSLAFLKHLLTSDKRQQILFLWLTPLCWLAGFCCGSLCSWLPGTNIFSCRDKAWVLLDQSSRSGSGLPASPRLAQVQGKRQSSFLKTCAQSHWLTTPCPGFIKMEYLTSEGLLDPPWRTGYISVQ